MDVVYHQTGQIWASGQDKTPWGSLESLEGDSHEREKKKRERSLGAKVSIDSCEGGGRRELVIFFFFFHCMYVQGGRLVREED